MTQFAVKVYPNGNTEVLPFVGDQLKLLQEAVGGWVETYTLDENLSIWFNEEGKIHKLPFNQAATSLWMKHKGGTDFIVGVAVFTGGTDDEGNSLGLDEAGVQKVRTFAEMSKIE